MVDAREQACDAPDVVALLPLAKAAAHHDVPDRLLLERGVALEQRLQRDRSQIVGANALQRALGGAPDGRADCIDDHCFWHQISVSLDQLGRGLYVPRPGARRAGSRGGGAEVI